MRWRGERCKGCLFSKCLLTVGRLQLTPEAVSSSLVIDLQVWETEAERGAAIGLKSNIGVIGLKLGRPLC